MLKKHLTTVPLTKFVLIQDSLKHTSKSLVRWLIGNHMKKGLKVHFFMFEGSTRGGLNHELVQNFTDTPGVVLHDFSDDPNGWLNVGCKSFEKDFAEVTDGIVVVDSLMHVVYYYGLPQLIGVINKSLNRTGVQQLVGVLHTDLVDDPKIQQYLGHISTLDIKLGGKNQCVEYVYKKLTGKVQKGIEQYEIANGDLQLKPFAQSDSYITNSPEKQILPETLTTFKITLDDKAKKLKDKLVLPYLPRDNEETGKITYEFDNSDDWDEEDPDDDLDI